MRYYILILTVIWTVILGGCANDRNSKKLDSEQSVLNEKIDSLKWLFYAYTFDGKVFFQQNQKEYHTIECEVVMDKVEERGDSLFCYLSYYKDGLRYSHIRDGLNINGFIYYSGVAKPLTGMLSLDSFDLPSYVRKDNIKTDSVFREFIKRLN